LTAIAVHGVRELKEQAIAFREGRKFFELFGEVWEQVNTIRSKGDIGSAFDYVSTLPADLRTLIKARLIVMSGGKTACATAAAITDLIEGITAGQERLVSVQVKTLNTDHFHGVDTVIGRPVSFSFDGWAPTASVKLSSRELDELHGAWTAISSSIEHWRKDTLADFGETDDHERETGTPSLA
ncbi:MAG: hypothetical protein AAF497_29735, partial [Planctomycetota bacterium]